MQFIETAVSKAFVREVGLPEGEMNLARAGLLFARAEYPELDCGWYLGQLDLIAHDIGTRVEYDAGPDVRLAVMIQYLFGDLGFNGNVDDYYDPRNSYLNEVIDRRLGIPITLSIIFLELAERVGLSAQGISFPGHFLVAVDEGEDVVIVDAFDGGAMLARETFMERLRERADSETSSDALETALRPASKLETLLRQLRNLKSVYTESGDVEKTLNILNHMLTIDKELLPELLERAALYETLGYVRGAVEDYGRALGHISPGADREEIRDRLRRAQAQAQHLH